jgi:hypothetical protein
MLENASLTSSIRIRIAWATQVIVLEFNITDTIDTYDPGSQIEDRSINNTAVASIDTADQGCFLNIPF